MGRHGATFRSDLPVTLLGMWGSDLDIAQAARVSTDAGIDSDISEKHLEGLINYLMAHRHGSPFEVGMIAFHIEVPLFTQAQHLRHRIGWSVNQLSGRYSDLAGHFWIPPDHRPLRQVGTSARPEMEYDRGLVQRAQMHLRSVGTFCQNHYEEMLDEGICREVARAVLPESSYTRARWQANPRSMMHFLSLRIHDRDAAYVSYPQEEIQTVARQYEQALKNHWPITWAAFVKHGRVAP